jgi:hypothetical protein
LLRVYKDYTYIFINDIIIYSDNTEDYLRYLNRLFKLFSNKNITIVPTKLYIGYPNIELLGFRIDNLGLTTIA